VISVSTDPVSLLSEDAAQASVSGGRGGFPGDLFAWFGGARASILRLCPSERSLYAGLGMGVLLTAVFGGVSAAFALSYVLSAQVGPHTHQVPVSHLWPVVLFWGVTLANLDRLMLLVTSSKKWLLAMLPRLAISVFLGFLIAEPLTLRIFQPETNAQMATTTQQAQATQLASIAHTYQPRITSDENKIASLHQELLNDKNAIAYYQFKVHWKRSSPAVPGSFRVDPNSPWGTRFQHKAAAAQANYDAVAPGINRQIATLQGDVSLLGSQESAAEQKVHAAIASSSGWAAREAALNHLAAHSAGVNLTIWLVRLAFVLIDLAPLLVKFLVVLFGKQVYDEIAAAVRERHGVHAYGLRAQAGLERNMVDRRADAQDDIDEARVDAYREQQVAAAYAHAQAGGPGWTGSSSGKARGPRIPAWSLGELVPVTKIHERMAVPMARALTQVAWIGTGLLAGLDLALWVARSASHVSITGGWLALGALAAALALAAYSRGFRHGPAWAHRAAFTTGLLGLAVPAAIIAMNL
jgi:Domain of unknown function (DUF4407)